MPDQDAVQLEQRLIHMREAEQALGGLSPEERALYARHLYNLYSGEGVRHDNGDVSTLYATTVERDGRTYIVPTVSGGRIGDADEAIDAAVRSGMRDLPHYPSEEEAQARYMAMHAFMDRDVGDFIKSGQTFENQQPGLINQADSSRSN